MNTTHLLTPSPNASTLLELRDTRDAFDSVAADYDGPRGNNALIQDMRSEMWRWLDAVFATPSTLIDIGCGTGIDAIRMARLGHHVTATDWSPQMVRRTHARAEHDRLTASVQALTVGAHELHRLGGDGRYDGAYSNLGPLNCVPDLNAVSRECARLLKPRGVLVFTVIGRICPWEIVHFVRKREWARAKVRFLRGFVPVGMNRHTIWTHYYSPSEFYRPFGRHFTLEHYRGLCVFAPPPYIPQFREQNSSWYRRLWRLDQRLAGRPVLRAMGDHFLIVMRKR